MNWWSFRSLRDMRFIIFVIDGETNSASRGELEAIDAFNDRLRSEGHWIMAAGIAGPGSATLIDGRSGRSLSESSSLFDTPEYYSGFWIIDAPSTEEAKQLAHEGSAACNRRVELRPFLGNV